jgi:hypothetical protein
LKNLYLGLVEQGPFSRAFKNFFITGNAWGLFHKRSHYREDGSEKMGLSKKSAIKAAKKMEEKHSKHFSVYKCIYCDRYHIGKNRENK